MSAAKPDSSSPRRDRCHETGYESLRAAVWKQLDPQFARTCRYNRRRDTASSTRLSRAQRRLQNAKNKNSKIDAWKPSAPPTAPKEKGEKGLSTKTWCADWTAIEVKWMKERDYPRGSFLEDREDTVLRKNTDRGLFLRPLRIPILA